MAEPHGTERVSAGNEPRKAFNRNVLLLMVGALLVIMALFYVFAFTRQQKQGDAPNQNSRNTPSVQMDR